MANVTMRSSATGEGGVSVKHKADFYRVRVGQREDDHQNRHDERYDQGGTRGHGQRGGG